MAIDASIYSNVQAPQINIPSPMDAAEKSMRLSELGMQQAQMHQQMQNQMALRQAYAKNTDPNTGQLNRAGFLSDLGKSNPMAVSQYHSQFAQQDKQQAEAQIANAQAQHQILSLTLPALKHLYNMPDDQAAAAYHGVLQQLADQGVPMQNAPAEWNRKEMEQKIKIGDQMHENLENQLTQAQIGKVQNETGELDRNRQTNYQKMANDDEVIKKANGMISEGKSVLKGIDDAMQNPQSRSALALSLARFATGNQRMNETEIEKLAKSGSLPTKIAQMYNDSKNGLLTQENADFARQYVTTQMDAAAKNKLDQQNHYAGQYAVTSGLPLSQAFSRLYAKNPGTLDEVPSGPAAFAKNQQGGSGNGGGVPGVPSANASEKPAATPADSQALQWLKTTDPSDPMAFKVRAKLKAKGLL